MRCFVDNREVPGGAIRPPAMNYGQHWQWEGYRRCLYRFIIPVDEFLARVSHPFDGFRREVAEDLAGHDDDGPNRRSRRSRCCSATTPVCSPTCCYGPISTSSTGWTTATHRRRPGCVIRPTRWIGARPVAKPSRSRGSHTRSVPDATGSKFPPLAAGGTPILIVPTVWLGTERCRRTRTPRTRPTLLLAATPSGTGEKCSRVRRADASTARLCSPRARSTNGQPLVRVNHCRPAPCC